MPQRPLSIHLYRQSHYTLFFFSLPPPLPPVFHPHSFLFTCFMSISFLIPCLPPDLPNNDTLLPEEITPVLTKRVVRRARESLRVARTPGIRASANGIWIIEYPPYPARIYERVHRSVRVQTAAVQIAAERDEQFLVTLSSPMKKKNIFHILSRRINV